MGDLVLAWVNTDTGDYEEADVYVTPAGDLAVYADPEEAVNVSGDGRRESVCSPTADLVLKNGDRHVALDALSSDARRDLVTRFPLGLYLVGVDAAGNCSSCAYYPGNITRYAIRQFLMDVLARCDAANVEGPDD